MSKAIEHEAEQEALCARYEALFKIQQWAVDLGMHIDDVNNERTCYEFLVKDGSPGALRVANEWKINRLENENQGN